jgi:hypothetical protein
VESFFDIWYDHTTPKENAEQFDVNKQAFYTVANGFGSGRPGVLFTADQTATGYGNSDIMTIDWSKDITTDKEDKWNPSKAAKTLFVVFKTGADVTGDNHPYYCDGRQTLLEAGGPLSGYNIYIQNSKLCFGMWNRFEQKFFMYDPPNSENGIYPLSPESIYVAQLQYDGTNFRSALVKQGISSIALSQPLPFAGISRDMSDNSAIGGASRTRYHDYSTGETYSDHFSGVLGDILLYNKALSQAEAQAVYDFLAGRYGLGDIDFISPKQVAEDWRVYEYLEQSEENRLSQSYPNPFTGETNFAVFLKEGSNVAITLHDIRGTLIHTIYSGELGKGLHNFMIDGTSLAQGVYTYRILGANFSEAAKAVLIK